MHIFHLNNFCCHNASVFMHHSSFRLLSSADTCECYKFFFLLYRKQCVGKHYMIPDWLTHLCPPLRSTLAVRETASLDIRGAPRVPPLCRETQSLGQQMLNAPVGINGLTSKCMALDYFIMHGLPYRIEWIYLITVLQ